MGAVEEAMQGALKAFAGRGVKVITDGIATDITATNFTLKRENAPDIFDVRLDAIDDNLETRITIIPKDGSHVVVGILNNLVTEAVLLKCSEVEKVIMKMGVVQFEVDANKVVIKKGEESLSKIISDIIAEISKIVVMVGTSPNIPTLTQIDNRQKQFLG